MHKRNAFATTDVFGIASDILIIIAAYALSALIYSWVRGHSYVFTRYVWMLTTFSVIIILLMLFLRMYNVTTFRYLDRTIIRVTASVFVASLCIASMIFLLKIEDASRMFFLLLSVLALAALLGKRILTAKLKIPLRKASCADVLFIGDDKSFETYKIYINKTSIRCTFDGFLEYSDKRIDTPERFADYVAGNSVDEVVITYNPAADFKYESYVAICEDMGITVRLIVDLFDTNISKKFVSSIGTLPIITYHSVSKNGIQIFFKKILDICGAVIAIALSSPVLLFTAIAIKLDSPGPVFFRQKRVGRNGKVFEILKFRSMYIDAEERKKELAAHNKIAGGLMFKMDDDPRITKVGKVIRKLSIDELPQFFNVLIGQMSIVGTRPPTVDEVKMYERRHRRRISIRPGITGMWQVSGRSDITDFEQVVELDTKYIDEWTLMLDLKLVFKTVGVVLAHKGAH